MTALDWLLVVVTAVFATLIGAAFVLVIVVA